MKIKNLKTTKYFCNLKAQTGWTLNSPYIHSTVSTDRVGIGTTAPVYPLQIGTVISAGNLSSGGTFGVSIATGTASGIGEQSTDKHAVFGALGINKDILFPTYNGTSFDEWMRITYQGKVGIGTSSPTNQLDVLSANPMVRAGISTGTTSYAAFTAHDITANKSIVQLMGGSAMAGTLFGVSRAGCGQFYANSAPIVMGTIQAYDLTLGTNSISRVTVKSTGNVGIGTTTPASKLDVEGNLAIGATYSGTTAAPTNGVIIEGNVGIGISSPTYKLDIYTNTPSDHAIRAISTATSGGNLAGEFIANGTGSGANWGLYTSATNGASNIGLYVNSVASGASNYSIYNGANAKSYFAGAVGIGNTAPSYKLDVTGDVRATGVMSVGTTPSGSYRLTINGDGLAVGGDFYPSDQFFKTEIDSLQNALATIKQLKPKTYYFDTTNVWGLNFSNKKQYGFLAQELEQVLPDIIKTSTKEADVDTLGNIVHPAVTFKAVNYTEFIAILTKGIQELQQKNDSLQTELNKQDSVNTSQQNQMNLIQNQLVANSTLFQDQLNQLLSTINDCCNRPQESSANNSQTKSMTTSESGTTQIDVELNNSQTIVLQQNHPNPYAEKTAINYYLPDNTGKAEILFYNTQGRLIKSVELINKGKGTLNVFAGDLSSGIYTYTLIVDGKVIETKKMVKQ